MRSLFLALCLAASGCAGAHTQDRVENATTAAGYQEALEKCLTDAIATRQTTGNSALAEAQYEACALDADKKYGRVTK